MRRGRKLEQQIAVFGESGSGKTVLLSTFYGVAQERRHAHSDLFHLVADDPGQGTRLHRNYLGMKNSARLPMVTRFSATSYSFSVRLKDAPEGGPTRARPFDALRLVWHDYPGEWFEEGVSGEEEARRRLDVFRALLGSDVALLLVDAQRLLDNAGEEERYLRSLLSTVRNGLLSLQDDLLEDGPLVDFPRIWVLALSKSDLMPDLDVDAFRDLLVEKAGDDVEELRAVLGGLVEAGDVLSLGEDFLLLSSARFETGAIDVARRVGLDLLLPLAAALPLERHARWARAARVPRKVVDDLVGSVLPLAAAQLGRRIRLPGPAGVVLGLLDTRIVDDVAARAGDKLREANARAQATGDRLTAALTRFRLDLDRGEQEHVLLRSRR